MPKGVQARAAQDEQEERQIRKLQATLDGARTQSDPAHLPTRGCALASYPQLGDQR